MEGLAAVQGIDGFRYSPLSMEERGRALASYFDARTRQSDATARKNGPTIRMSIGFDRIEGDVVYLIQSKFIDSVARRAFSTKTPAIKNTIDLAPLNMAVFL
jgi:hypothetical protein